MYIIDNEFGAIFVGLLIGGFIGLSTVVICGGFIANILNMVENIEKIEKRQKI